MIFPITPTHAIRTVSFGLARLLAFSGAAAAAELIRKYRLFMKDLGSARL
jgi:hypothetical protein